VFFLILSRCGTLHFFIVIRTSGDGYSLLGSKKIASAAHQCCGSGSGIRCLFDPWIRVPGWVEVRIRIRDPG
jgi:hypothetical protein